MKDLNKVQLTGHLGADPEMRYTPQGNARTTFRVASNRTWRDKDGNAHEETEWFRIVAWDRLAEICNEYLSKGTRVYIEGRLQTRRWTDDNGQDRYITEVVAQEMIILSRPQNNGNYDDDGTYDDSSDDGDGYDETPPSPSGRPSASTSPGPGRPSTPTSPGLGRPSTPTSPGLGRPSTPTSPGLGRPSTPTSPGLGRPSAPPRPTSPGPGRPPAPPRPTSPGAGRPPAPTSFDDEDIPF